MNSRRNLILGAVALVVLTFVITAGGALYVFSQVVPDSVGVDGIGMWGQDLNNDLNRFTAVCCLDAGETANDGITMLATAFTPTITLATGHAITMRWILRVGPNPGTRYLKLYEQTGAPIAGGATPSTGVRLDIIPPQATGGQ